MQNHENALKTLLSPSTDTHSQGLVAKSQNPRDEALDTKPEHSRPDLVKQFMEERPADMSLTEWQSRRAQFAFDQGVAEVLGFWP